MVKSKSRSRRKKNAGVKRLTSVGGFEVVRDGNRERGGGGVGEGDEDGVVPCPVPRDPAMGDKTPEVMAWYREYRPEEFKRRYGNRVCPVVDDEAVRMLKGAGCVSGDEERGPVSDFEDGDDDAVVVKPRVIMG